MIVLAASLSIASPAYAYLDPGTGSMLLSAVFGVAAAVALAVKMFWYRNGSTEGTALHAVDYYDMTNGTITKHSPTASCGTQFSNS